MDLYEKNQTSTRLAVPILPPAMVILEKYTNYPICIRENKALPVLSNQKMNEYLRKSQNLQH